MRGAAGKADSHRTEEGNEEQSAADMVSEAENVIMAWHLSLLVSASMLCRVREKADCLLPPCDS